MAKRDKENTKRGLLANLPRFLIFIIVFGASVFILLQLMRGNNAFNRNYTSIPKEMQLTYQDAAFEPAVDAENALAILSNPKRYKREFDQLVYDYNFSILSHVAKRMGVWEELNEEIERTYQSHHRAIKEMYYNDFTMLQDTTSIAYKTWYGSALVDAVDYLNEVASKYTCFMVNLVLTTVLQTQGGSIAATGNQVETPCGIAMTEGLRPMIGRLQEKAAIEDFSRAKGLVQQRVERSIAELATMQIEDTKALSRKLQSKLFGYAISSTDVEISAISYVKVGFDLQKYFDMSVNTGEKMVIISLPEPEILSLEVFPRVDKMEIGWLRELESNDLNKDMKLLADAFREDALNSDVFGKAKSQVAQLMETMLGPLVTSLGKSYKLRIQFRQEMPLDSRGIES